MYIYRCLQFRSLVNCYILPIAYEGELEGRDGYRDQIDVGISLHAFQDTSTVHEVQQWHKHTVLCILLSELVSCAFSTIPICSFLIQRMFFIYMSPLIFYLFETNWTTNCMFIYSFSANQELNFLMYGENTIHRPMYTVYKRNVCPFCNSPNCSTNSSPQNVLTCNLASGHCQEAVATWF